MDKLESSFWSLMRSHIPARADVQRIETGSTGRGIPDVNVCLEGNERWWELKIVKGRKVDLTPEQISWHFRRTRAGGVTWIVARDKVDGVRKGKYDKIYAWLGGEAIDVKRSGILHPTPYIWGAPFKWVEIMDVLLK